MAMKYFPKKKQYPVSHLNSKSPIVKIVACVKRGDIDQQRAQVQEIAENEGAEIVGEFFDLDSTISRVKKDPKKRRPVLVVCCDCDPSMLALLMESGVGFILCGSNAKELLPAISEWEARLISEINREVFARAKDNGVKLGSARPGHWKGREHLRGNLAASKAAAKARTQRSKDVYRSVIGVIRELLPTHNYDQIAEELTKRQFLTAAGQPFKKAAVCRAIQTCKRVPA